MGFVGKLPLVLAFYKHSAVRVRGGDGLFLRFAAFGRLGIVVIIFVLNGLLAQLLTLCVDFLPELSRIDLRDLCHPLFLELLFVGTRFDMGSVNKDNTGVYHAVVQCFVQNMLKDLGAQLRWKSSAKGIAHRSKVRNVVQQPVAKEPPISQIHLDLPVSLAQGRDPKQMLNQHHLD